MKMRRLTRPFSASTRPPRLGAIKLSFGCRLALSANALKASTKDLAPHLPIALRKVVNSRENAANIGVRIPCPKRRRASAEANGAPYEQRAGPAIGSTVFLLGRIISLGQDWSSVTPRRPLPGLDRVSIARLRGGRN